MKDFNKNYKDLNFMKEYNNPNKIYEQENNENNKNSGNSNL